MAICSIELAAALLSREIQIVGAALVVVVVGVVCVVVLLAGGAKSTEWCGHWPVATRFVSSRCCQLRHSVQVLLLAFMMAATAATAAVVVVSKGMAQTPTASRKTRKAAADAVVVWCLANSKIAVVELLASVLVGGAIRGRRCSCCCRFVSLCNLCMNG